MAPTTPRDTPKQRVRRRFPMATWCNVTKRVYFGTCMSKSAASWRSAARQL